MSMCKDASGGEAKVDAEVPVKRCQFCSWMRHLSKDCRSKGDRGSKTGDGRSLRESQERESNAEFSCCKMGHMAMNCPSRALACLCSKVQSLIC